MAPFDPNLQTRRFGEIAQQANPQVSDPNQNRNLAGFPQGKPRFSQTPPTSPLVPKLQPTVDPAAEKAALEAIPEKNRDSALAGGQYGGGTYTPIAEGDQWSGQGYAGPDPRDAAAPAAEAPEGIQAPPPGADGGKGGAMAAAEQAGWTPPPGASGGKGGGASPPEAAAPAAPAAPEPGSNVEPAGEIGQTGGTNPDGSPIRYEDTGTYASDSGGFEGVSPTEFIPTNSIPGVVTKKPNLADPHPKVKKRLDAYVAAGGDPNNFVIIDQSVWETALAGLTGQEKNQKKKELRDKFYADQIISLGVQGTGKPGVQEG